MTIRRRLETAAIDRLRQRATDTNNVGRRREAARLYLRALHAADEAGLSPADEKDRQALRVRTRIGLAFTLLEDTNWRDAMAWVDQADALAQVRPDLLAIVHRQRGVMFARTGRHHDARLELDVAWALRHHVDPLERILVLLNRGLLQAYAGQPDSATADFTELLRLATEHDFPAERFMGTANLALAAYLAGDIPRSLDLFAAAEAMDVEVTRAPLIIDRAAVLLDAGLVEDAVRILEAAIPDCEAKQQRYFLSDIDRMLVHAHHSLGDLDTAAKVAARARRRMGPSASPSMRDGVHLPVLTIALARGRPPVAIARTADRIHDQAHARGDTQTAVDAGLLAGEAWLAAGQPDRLVRTLDAIAALPGARPTTLTHRLRTARLRAEHAAATGNATAARRELDRAARDLERAQAGIASIDLRTGRARHTTHLLALDLRLARERGVGAMFSRTEIWRAATARLAPVQPPEDPLAAELVARMRAAVAILPNADRAQAHSLRTEIAHLGRRIREQDWTHGSHTPSGAIKAMSYAEARRRLDASGTDVVTFFPLEDRVHAIGIIGGRTTIADCLSIAAAQELTRRLQADLRVLATQRVTGALAGAVSASLHDTLTRLDSALLGHFPTGERAVAVVPSISVSQLPWGMFPRLRGLPLTVARSVTTFLRPADAPASPLQVRVVTGPDVDLAGRESAGVLDAWQLSGDPALHGSTTHFARVALAGADLVHIAAHGHHEPFGPLFSSLDLVDGPLFAYELQSSGVGAAHVALSACETGDALVRPGEETLGFATTMLALGAHAVVAALGAVPDETAAALMVRYHRDLAAGRPTDEALALAVESVGGLAGLFSAFGSRWSAPHLGHGSVARHVVARADH